jgi:hypothetical protein
MDKLTGKITAELYRALEELGAKSDLLSIVGSWGDSLSDEQVLSMLRAWNATTAHTGPA